MKKLNILLTLGSAVATFSFMNSAIQINQQVNAQGEVVQANFQENIVVKAFDRYTGNFYVGTEADNGEYSIARAGRTDSGFTALATNANNQIAINENSFALINNTGTEATHLALGSLENGALGVINLATASTIAAEPIKAALGAAGDAGDGLKNICTAQDHANNAASSFTNLAGGYSETQNMGYTFLRVHPETANALHSGILAMKFNNDVDDLLRVGRVGGSNPNNIAVRLDNLRGSTAGDGSFLRHGSDNQTLTALPEVQDMYWDPNLETLFICGSCSPETPLFGNNYYQIIMKAKIKADGQLELSDIIPAETNAAAGSDQTIFAFNVAAGGEARDMLINKIRTMKTSTGRYYIIVNGDISHDAIGNIKTQNVYALQYNPDGVVVAGKEPGTIVANDNAKTDLTNEFIRTGGAAASQSLDGGNNGSILIGGEAAPWEVEYSASDMEVIGDTVYVSFKNQIRNEDNDPGVWASSALFDNNGVIIGWTAWERVFTSDPVNNVDYADKPYFFSVDGKTGQLWQVVEDYTTPAQNPRVVERTKITTSDFAATSLQGKINADFADGCTCVLDLPKNTPGIYGEDSPSNSFVLFGGIEKVAFAQTKNGEQDAVTTDFTDFYIKTDLPSDAGVVRCLGFARNNEELVEDNTRGYFFAGTDNGLYVFANTDDKQGFKGDEDNQNGLTTIGAPDDRNYPFDGTFSWQKMATNNITGAVSSIESDGENIFVVEQDTTVKNSAISRIWRIVLGDDVTTMEGATTKIAESGSAEIPPNAIITGLQLITNGTFGTHYGVISTNAGIYLSDQILSAIGPEDNWVLVDGSKAYHSCYSPKRVPTVIANEDGANHNVWGIALADDDRGLEYYQNSTLQQFGFNNVTSVGGAKPENFTNGSLDVDPQSPLEYIDRTTSFWTDGGRRFYARFDARENINNSLRSLPYYAQEWAMTTPTVFPELSSISRIYWIENISALGIVLAGTDDGVISLVE